MDEVSVRPRAEAHRMATPEAFRGGMRRLAGACTIITSTDGSGAPEGWVGLAATAVASVTADPPRLLVCINRNVWAHKVITASGVLAINVLGKAQESILGRFSGAGICAPAEKFHVGNWRAGATGAPLLGDALVAFDCTVTETIVASTHDIFLGDVLAVHEHGDAIDPLIYFNGAFFS